MSTIIDKQKYKLVIIGDISVGKTAITERFNTNKFNNDYSPSIGIDFCNKDIKFKNIDIKISVWDTAGQEKYKSLIPNYIKNANIIFLIYDITKRDSFENINKWLQFVESIRKCIYILIGNKYDLTDQRQITYEEALNYSNNKNLLFFECSAKSGYNINYAFYSSFLLLPCFANMFNDEMLKNRHNLVSEFINSNSPAEKQIEEEKDAKKIENKEDLKENKEKKFTLEKNNKKKKKKCC